MTILRGSEEVHRVDKPIVQQCIWIVQEGTITPNTNGSPTRSKNEKQLEIHQLIDVLSFSASNSATEHMDTHNGVQEGTITPNTDGSPIRSKNVKQLEMEGHRDFIQECAIEDEE
jgi:hypothetical protein